MRVRWGVGVSKRSVSTTHEWGVHVPNMSQHPPTISTVSIFSFKTVENYFLGGLVFKILEFPKILSMLTALQWGYMFGNFPVLGERMHPSMLPRGRGGWGLGGMAAPDSLGRPKPCCSGIITWHTPVGCCMPGVQSPSGEGHTDPGRPSGGTCNSATCSHGGSGGSI